MPSLTCYDALDDQIPRSRDRRVACAWVCMFPANPTILLMQAGNVLGRNRVAFGITQPAREILDRAETVASKGQIVRAAAGTRIAKIESLFPVVWTSRITVRHCHLRNAQSIEQWPTIISYIMDGSAFAIIESYSETPKTRKAQKSA